MGGGGDGHGDWKQNMKPAMHMCLFSLSINNENHPDTAQRWGHLLVLFKFREWKAISEDGWSFEGWPFGFDCRAPGCFCVELRSWKLPGALGHVKSLSHPHLFLIINLQDLILIFLL